MTKSYNRLIWILAGGMTYVEETERSSEVGRNEGKTTIKIIEEKEI